MGWGRGVPVGVGCSGIDASWMFCMFFIVYLDEVVR